MRNLIQPVVLCGGSGSRLWPLSRAGFPKQFLCLTGDESLFQQATKRLMTLAKPEVNVAAPYIVTNEEHRFLVQEQLREIGIELGVILLEPVGRNTAPALTLAALAAVEEGNDPVLVVTPADQTVADADRFAQAMHQAIQFAANGQIAILGITPDRPETGYGYIKVAQSENNDASNFVVERSLPWEVPYELPEGYRPKIGQGVTLVAGADITIIAYGPVLLSAAVAASRILSQEKKLSVKVINLPWLNRIDNDWLKKELKSCRKLLSLDNHYKAGGQSDLIAKALAQAGIEIEFHNLGISQIPPSGTNSEVLDAVGLDTTAKLVSCIREVDYSHKTPGYTCSISGTSIRIVKQTDKGQIKKPPVARTQNLELAMLTFKAFGRGAVAGVALSVCIAVLLVAQMLG